MNTKNVTKSTKNEEEKFVEKLTCSDLCFIDFKHNKQNVNDDLVVKKQIKQKIFEKKCTC